MICQVISFDSNRLFSSRLTLQRGRLAAVVLSTCAILISPSVTLGQPTVTAVSPAAVRPGQAVELTMHGKNLAGDLAHWTSFPAVVEWLPAAEGQDPQAIRRCRVTLDANIPVGIGGIILGNATGSTDPQLVMIDDIASAPEAANNHSIENSQLLTLPMGIDGTCDGSVFDYFKFVGAKGQRVSVECLGLRMGHDIDAVLRLLDSAGKELALVDDDPSTGADPRLSIVLPADGTFVIELHDNRFRAGRKYRLRVGDFPLVSTPFPMGGRRGSTVRLTFNDAPGFDSAPVFLQVPVTLSSGILDVSARLAGGQSSTMATVIASQLPESVEFEPNNDLAQSTPVTIPCAVNGRFADDDRQDCFQFAAAKGATLRIQSFARSLGSPTLVMLRLLNSSGQQVAESPINDGDETSLTFAVAADDLYCLVVSDLLSRFGPGFSYRVEIQADAKFSLSIKNDKDARLRLVAATNSGAFPVALQIDRQGYDGPIQLRLQDPIEGVVLHDDMVPSNAKDHRLLIELRGVPAGKLLTMRLCGEAESNGRVVRADVESLGVLRAAKPYQPYPPAWMDGLVLVTSSAESDSFFQLNADATPVRFVRSAGTVTFALNLERKQAEFKDAVSLLFENLPAGFSATAKPEGDKYNITLTGPKDAAVGMFSFTVVSFGQFKGAGRIVRTDVSMEVTAE